MFTDKNNNGVIDVYKAELDNEIILENHYYPFGMTFGGNVWINESTDIDHRYQYNGKELNNDHGLGWYNYGARFYDAVLGRFTGVDALADFAPDWTPYRYGFDNPIIYVDPDGLFESKEAAKSYAKEEGIRTGLFSNNKIRAQSDGTYAIENKKEHTSTSDLGGDFGVMTGVMVTPSDKNNTRGGFEVFGYGVGRELDTPSGSSDGIIDMTEMLFPSGGGVSKTFGLPNQVLTYTGIARSYGVNDYLFSEEWKIVTPSLPRLNETYLGDRFEVHGETSWFVRDPRTRNDTIKHVTYRKRGLIPRRFSRDSLIRVQ